MLRVQRIRASQSVGRGFRLTVLTIIVSFALPSASAVATVTDAAVLTTRVYEEDPAATTGFLTWDQNSLAHPNHFDVYAKPTVGPRFKVNAAGTSGRAGGIDGPTLAYQQFVRGSDIKFFNLKTRRRANPPSGVNTKQWEYWPRGFERPWLLFARLNVRARTRSIVLFNLLTHRSRVLDVVGEKKYVQPGQINGGTAVWVHWVSPARSRIFIYDIAKKTLTKVPNTKGYDWAPSVTENGTVYFERTGARCGSNPRIMRYQQASTPTTVVQLPSGIDMSSSYVFPLSDGRIQVLHDRIRCSNLRFGDDIYRFADDFTLTLSVTIVGSGSVTSSPAGIDCSPTCSHEFEPNTMVTLTAAPGVGSTFVGWSDPSCLGTDPCTLTMTSDTSITATFNP